jgi:DNA-binding Lrp family transcriptional regulator
MSGSFPLDRIDRKILLNLQAEGRLTNEALSERVALSPSACLARVRRLERANVIQGYHARLDPFRIEVGLVLFAEVTLKTHGAADLARFDAVIGTIPEIVEGSHVSGAFDYILKVVVANLERWSLIGEQLTAEAGVDRISTHVLLHKPKVFVGYPITAD